MVVAGAQVAVYGRFECFYIRNWIHDQNHSFSVKVVITINSTSNESKTNNYHSGHYHYCQHMYAVT